jgi:hypothetical protein
VQKIKNMVDVSFLGYFWHAIRTHVHCIKNSDFFLILHAISPNLLLKQEHMSLGVEKPCPQKYMFI